MIFGGNAALIFPAEADGCGFPGDAYPMRAPEAERVILRGVRLELRQSRGGASGRMYIPLCSCRCVRCDSGEALPIRDAADRITYGCVVECDVGGEVYRMRVLRVRRTEAPGGSILDHMEVEMG